MGDVLRMPRAAPPGADREAYLEALVTALAAREALLDVDLAGALAAAERSSAHGADAELLRAALAVCAADLRKGSL